MQISPPWISLPWMFASMYIAGFAVSAPVSGLLTIIPAMSRPS